MIARKCPICGKTVKQSPEDLRPFCSPTCKLVDLGRWLDGLYAVPGPPLEIENDAHAIQIAVGTEEQ